MTNAMPDLHRQPPLAAGATPYHIRAAYEPWKPRVYLACPMKGVPFERVQAMREDITERLAPEIVCYSPLRAVESLSGAGPIAASYENSILHSAKGLTARDRNDVRTANLVFANYLGADWTRSIGTAMEVAWADAWRIPVVIGVERGIGALHPMLYECAGWIVHDLDEAAYVIRSALLP
jgi:hypothetical protein